MARRVLKGSRPQGAVVKPSTCCGCFIKLSEQHISYVITFIDTINCAKEIPITLLLQYVLKMSKSDIPSLTLFFLITFVLIWGN